MQNDPHFPKTPKGELLCKLVTRYPSIDYSTVQVISHIQAISKNISALINRDLAEFDLTEGKFYVLTFLLSEEHMGREDPSPSQIAENVRVTRGTVTGLLDGLERDGYVERIHDLRDRRGLIIRITDKARSFLDGFLPNVTCSLQQVVPLNETEKQEVTEYLERIDSAVSAITPLNFDNG
jgi:DNA-binding MarR family transcriptional regulator